MEAARAAVGANARVIAAARVPAATAGAIRPVWILGIVVAMRASPAAIATGDASPTAAASSVVITVAEAVVVPVRVGRCAVMGYV